MSALLASTVTFNWQCQMPTYFPASMDFMTPTPTPPTIALYRTHIVSVAIIYKRDYPSTKMGKTN